MSERTYSHKSDGRQSSAGHSVHSATSGRANSMGIDITFGPQTSGASSYEAPGLAPGLFILGSVPAIIRCWLNTNFKNDSLLYAAVCTGSHTSFLDSRLVDQLGFGDQIETDDDGACKVKLAVYLPEAVPHPASSRSASPAPQIPSFTATFTVINQPGDEGNGNAIRVILGSDVLRAHNADILFSSNTLTMFDNERSKLSIPLVRPENENVFKTLCTTNGQMSLQSPVPKALESTATSGISNSQPALESPLPTTSDTERDRIGTPSDDGASEVVGGHHNLEERPVLSLLNTRTDSKNGTESNSAVTGSSNRAGSSPALWSSWRKDAPEKSAAMDWSSATKNPAQPYQRKDTGIKVLKPSKSSSRVISTASAVSASPVTSQSRFFDDGKRRVSTSGVENGPGQQLRRSISGESKTNPVSKENQPQSGKPRSTNPIGGASAFSWLKSGGQK